jgi:chromosome segregation ATPase
MEDLSKIAEKKNAEEGGEQNEDMRKELEFLRSSMKEASRNLAAARKREALLSDTVAQIREQMQVAREGMETVMKRDAAKQLELENLQRSMAMLGDERDVLKSELHRQQQQQQTEMDDALQELHEASEEATRAKAQSTEAAAARETLSAQLALLTRDLESLESGKREAARDVEAKEIEIQRLGLEVRDLQEQSAATSAAARDELALTLESLSKTRQSLSASQKEFQEERARLQARLEVLQGAVGHGTRKAAALEEEVRNLERKAEEAASAAAAPAGAPQGPASGQACKQCEVLQETSRGLRLEMVALKQHSDTSSTALAAALARSKELEGMAAEVETVKNELEAQRLRHNEKQREQLEKMSRERSKISDEMRSAFKELTARQLKLDLCKQLVALLDAQVLRDHIATSLYYYSTALLH